MFAASSGLCRLDDLKNECLCGQAAAQAGHLEVVRRLLNARAMHTVVDEDGQTALEKAQLYGHPKTAALLESWAAEQPTFG